MTSPITIECNIHFKRRGRGARKTMREGTASTPPPCPSGRVPRVARFMALAIRFDQLIRASEVADYAELARLAHVSRARITQTMNLLMLAPDIQEELLFLPRIECGCDPVLEHSVRAMAAAMDWEHQRRLFAD